MELINIAMPDLMKANDFLSPEEYNYWKGRENRIFYMDYDIGDDYSVIELSKSIIQMNFDERNIPKDELKPIYVMIHSYGGEVSQANFVCDLIKSSRIPIITVAMGVAMSAGFLIFISGHKRYAFPHSQLLVHSGSAELSGTAEQIDAAQKNYKKTLDGMKKYVLENTEIDEKTFTKNSKKDWYLTAEEIMKYKVADELITDLSVLFE